MSERINLNEEDLNPVTGGAITYTWDGTQGSLGRDGVNNYILLDKEAFLDVYNENFGKKSDAEIIRILKNKKIIKKP